MCSLVLQLLVPCNLVNLQHSIMQAGCPLYHLCNYCILQTQTMQYCISSITVMLKVAMTVANMYMLMTLSKCCYYKI